MTGWEDYYSRDIFVLKGSPHKDQIEELFIVMASLYVFPTRNIVNFSLISLFNCNIF